jgi:hypothetical protein
MDRLAILVNRCFGGFQFSKQTLDEYNKRMILTDNEFRPIKRSCDINREDHVMIKICQEIGNLVNAQHSHIKIKYIPIIYRDFYQIENYDGKEFVTIEFDKYKLDQIQKIVDDENISSEDKIKKIDSILHLELEFNDVKK